MYSIVHQTRTRFPLRVVQASFARNLEYARVDEVGNNNKSYLLLFELKEGETVTESLFSQLATVMEEKEVAIP